MQTNQQFDLAFNLLQNTGTNLFLTGKAGTGKTTFLKRLKEVSPKRMIVVAPTGVAAINAGGVTIHSFFQLPFGPYIPSSPEYRGGKTDFKNQFRKDKINIIRSMDLLVIDEVSMVRADLLDAISDVLRRYKDHSKPFGGVQLLLIGDLQQLAPVAKDDEWNLLKEHYPSTFFFDSKALLESNYFCIELTHVYRQSDTNFINLLNNIRENRFDDKTLQRLNQRYGAQVMFVKNDSSSEKRYYNGKIGKIVFINPNKITVVDREGNEIVVEKEIWNNVKYTIDPETKEITETITGTFSQYPLKTAWAITIHKSQGLTFEHAIIDASAAFSHGQVYVALSRCKTLEGLVLSSQITRNAMINDYRIQEFTSSVDSRQPREEQMQAAQQLYFTELICELFDFNNLQQRIQYAAFVVYGNLQKLYPELSVQYSNTRDAFRSTVTDVGERFIQQLKRLITGNTDYLKDETIQERVRKGVAYFLEQIDRLCTPLQEASNVEIDNKETRKTIKNALDKWNEDLRIKLSTLQGCQDGFTISGYLSAKAKASIEQPSVPTTRKRSEKSSEPAKLEISTDIKHPELYANLKRWRYEVATEKGLPTYTILQQKALIGVANTLPASGRDLLKIPGIGKKIVENYGAKLLEIVDDYRQGL